LHDGDLGGGAGAGAALLLLGGASRLLTLELALGTGAVGGLDALVLARGGLAHRAALGLGGLAGGVALGRLANVFTSGASGQLAKVLGATQSALGFGAMNGALGAGHFLTSHLTFGFLAHRVAHRGTRGIVTLPLALRMALHTRLELSFLFLSFPTTQP